MESKSTSPHWDELRETYEILKPLGSGAFGSVVKAKMRSTGEIVSIKLIEECFKNTHRARLLLREIVILRKLSEMPGNIFTTRLIDIILPQGCLEEELDTKKTGEIRVEADNLQVDVSKLQFIFIVMEFVDTDFQKLMNAVP